MALTDLIPWRKRRKEEESASTEAYPLQSLQRDMDRLFDRFFDMSTSRFAPFELSEERWAGFSPKTDIAETDEAFEVAFELPGLDDDDINVSVTEGALTVSGERREEHEDRKRNYYRMERSYGSFRRTIPLPDEIKVDEVAATYKRGVLTVTLPKTEVARSRKKITVKSG
jgi:HSP20 family protein